MKRRLFLVFLSGWAAVSLLVAGLFYTRARGGLAVPASTRDASPVDRADVLAAYGRLPLSFEENKGQTDPSIKFLAHGAGYTIFLTSQAATLHLAGSASYENLRQAVGAKTRRASRGAGRQRASVLRLTMLHSNQAALIEPSDIQPGQSNYFIGNDPAKWRRNVPRYARVKYRGVYPGMDLVFYGNRGQLESDYVLAAGANPNQIALRVEGAQHLKLASPGDLTITTASGDVVLHRPVAYQEYYGERREIAASYVRRGRNLIGIRLGPYDPGQVLIIDPVLSYSTFVGGSKPGFGNAVAIDSSGNAYITGSTSATDFPVTAGAFQPTSKDVNQPTIFVSKLNATASALVFSTYLGGSGSRTTGEVGSAIAVDAAGNVYVAGATSSTDFPTTATAYQLTNNANTNFGTCFLSELNPGGSSLVYSTYLGGTSSESCAGIALDANANVYLTGLTTSTNFPVTAATAIQTTNKATGGTAFVARVDTTKVGTGSLIYSTFFGGSATDGATSIAVDSNLNAYITGKTTSTDFPLTSSTAFQSAIKGTAGNAFIASFSTTTATLNYSSYLGGTATNNPGQRGFGDSGAHIALDPAFNAYVVGNIESPDFPTTAGAFQTAPKNSSNTAFVARFDTTKSGAASLVYSTALGGSSFDQGAGIAVDTAGDAFLTGTTESTDFPATPGAPQLKLNGIDNVFFTVLNPSGSALLFSTFLGGNNGDFGHGIAIDSSASPNAYVVGDAGSPNFPTTLGSFQTTFKTSNPFVAKLSPSAVTGVFATPGSLGFGNQNINTTSAAQIITLTNSSKNTVTITSMTFTGANSADFAQSATNCGASLAVGANCTISVTFKPSAAGSESATLSISDSDPSSPQTVSLSGTGITTQPDFTLSASPASLAATAGSGATFSVSVASVNGFASAVALTCTGAPAGATCKLNPASVTPVANSSATSNGAVATTARTMAPIKPRLRLDRPNRTLPNGLWLLCALLMLLVVWLFASRHRATRLAWTCALALALSQTSCSGLPHGGTPAGNFNLTITGTSGSLTHSIVVVLTVS